jgi:hypothetical protein
MTFEKKCLIEMEDIKAVQYECGKCHSAVVIPIHNLNKEMAASISMAVCNHCQTPYGFAPATQETRTFVEFSEALSKIAEVMKGRNLRFRLDIKCAE